jgi:hypothetical protein
MTHFFYKLHVFLLSSYEILLALMPIMPVMPIVSGDGSNEGHSTQADSDVRSEKKTG